MLIQGVPVLVCEEDIEILDSRKETLFDLLEDVLNLYTLYGFEVNKIIPYPEFKFPNKELVLKDFEKGYNNLEYECDIDQFLDNVEAILRNFVRYV